MSGDIKISLKINKKIGLFLVAAIGALSMADYVSIVNASANGGVVINNQEVIESPIGSVMLWTTATPPDKWIEMNGQSTASYPKLAAIVGGNVPDTRGEFVRGWDNGKGVDNGRSLKSNQLDQIQNITANWSEHMTNHFLAVQKFNPSGAISVGGKISGNYTDYKTIAHGQGAYTVSFDASRVARAGSETRGRNVALMYIIKAE